MFEEIFGINIRKCTNEDVRERYRWLCPRRQREAKRAEQQEGHSLGGLWGWRKRSACRTRSEQWAEEQ